eukprot:CAMPEP_0172620440 /NCGR_PEP_ID=MMETSP1068-20121228/103484_1 /TAXON_ID=35684 /ORGANISM="Pseudopedinella elastica, Strain CCMP716" /LENGTH=34 /DNA_ID= /DNA_START= /DNA_END= /DNA_ORIENTATION=
MAGFDSPVRADTRLISQSPDVGASGEKWTRGVGF